MGSKGCPWTFPLFFDTPPPPPAPRDPAEFAPGQVFHTWLRWERKSNLFKHPLFAGTHQPKQADRKGCPGEMQSDERCVQVECHGATRCFDQAVVAASRLGDIEQVEHIMTNMHCLRLRVGRVAHGSTIACIARTRGPSVPLSLPPLSPLLFIAAPPTVKPTHSMW